MIYIGDKKATISKGDFHPAALYKGDNKISGYTVTDIKGVNTVTLGNCYNDKLHEKTIQGKNILDMSKQSVSIGYYTDSSGTPNPNARFVRISPIAVKPLTTYTISSNLFLYNIWFFKGSSNSDSISGMSASRTQKKTFTTPENCAYIRVSMDLRMTEQEAEGVSAFEWAMLELGEGDGIYEAPLTQATITARGKNYFDLAKVPFNTTTTQAYKNGIMAKKVGTTNRGKNTPISIPSGKTIKISLDVVDSYIAGTSNHVVLGIRNDTDEFSNIRIPSNIGHVEKSITLSQDCTYIQFYFMYSETQNAPGDYVTMDNIMIRVEGDGVYEPYIEPQTITFENGTLAAEIPTFKGTTVIDVTADVEAHISGSYKKVDTE